MKHRRSSQKRKLTRSSNRYDKVLTKFKKMKKKGGLGAIRAKAGVPSHMVTPDNPVYKGVRVINTK